MRLHGDALAALHRRDAAVHIERLEEEIEKLHEELDEAIESGDQDDIDWTRERLLIAANDIDCLRDGTYRAPVEPYEESDRWVQKEEMNISWQRMAEANVTALKLRKRTGR